MSISYRSPKDMSKPDAMANSYGHSILPSALYEFRKSRGLSLQKAAALLGYQTTWWQWRESGHLPMPPEKFDEAQRLAPMFTPRTRKSALADQLAAAVAQIAALEQRVIALEAAQIPKHELI